MGTVGKARSQHYQRIVVKFGTGLVTGGGDRLNPEIMSGLAAQVAELHGQGRELIIVSSGAIASGRHKLGISRKVRGIPYKQVLAAVGQSRLMHFYDDLFGQYDITVAQALLARADLADRAGYLNARNTLLALLEIRVLPIVNENDVVAVDEIKEARFGDNDNLSGMITHLMDAQMLVILTDIDGWYDKDPRRHKDASLMPLVSRINSTMERAASHIPGPLGAGGMLSKLLTMIRMPL